jgi:hypothetical protein
MALFSSMCGSCEDVSPMVRLALQLEAFGTDLGVRGGWR